MEYVVGAIGGETHHAFTQNIGIFCARSLFVSRFTMYQYTPSGMAPKIYHIWDAGDIPQFIFIARSLTGIHTEDHPKIFPGDPSLTYMGQAG